MIPRLKNSQPLIAPSISPGITGFSLCLRFSPFRANLRPAGHRRSQQGGYALLMVMFALALLVIATATLAPRVITDVQREKEAELVWRGKQYTRGIRLYYMKTHRFPTSLEDLTTTKTGIRFMRRAYKDPMNPVDGSWRLIYVGPNGQLIGSLKPQTLSPFSSLTGAAGGAPGASPGISSGVSPGSSVFGNSLGSNSNANSFSQSSFGSGNNSSSSSFGSSSFGSTPQPQPLNGNNPNSQNTDANGDTVAPQGLNQNMDASNTVGGNIIGVGSKINKRSFLWFQKAKNYRQFEFIWDPNTDSLTGQPVGATPAPGTQLGGPANGQSPFGGNANSPNGPFSNGAAPPPNPPPNMNPDPNQQPPLQAPIN
jgi:type II secretory pathway pseudopilin PulG